jgi:hypothetical protein
MDDMNNKRGAKLWSDATRTNSALVQLIVELAKSNPRLAQVVAEAREANRKYNLFSGVADAFDWGEEE